MIRIALVLFCLAIPPAFYLLQWQQQLLEIGQLESTVADAESKLERSRQSIRDLPALTAQLDELEISAHELLEARGIRASVEPPELFLKRFQQEADGLARPFAGVRVELRPLKPAPPRGYPVPEGVVVAQQTLRMRVKGPTARVLGFLVKLLTAGPRLCVYSRMELTTDAAGNATAVVRVACEPYVNP